jgi:hypothetical protein
MTRSLSCLLASLRESPSTEPEKLMLKVERLGALSRQILILQEDCEKLECYHRDGEFVRTYLNAFAEVADSFSFCCGGVPVLDEAPESSPVLLNEPPGPILRPLLLRDENIDVGPKDIC